MSSLVRSLTAALLSRVSPLNLISTCTLSNTHTFSVTHMRTTAVHPATSAYFLSIILWFIIYF